MRDQPDARAGELAPRDLRVGPTRGARLLRPGQSRASRARSCASSQPTAKPPAAGPRTASSGARGTKVRRRRSEPVGNPGGAWAGLRHPRVRFRRRGPDRDALLRRARRDRVAHRVEVATRLPACLRARARQPARSRGRADVRRPERREAQRHAEPEAPRRGRARAPARRRVGRRRRRELRAARDARVRPRLRRARRAAARCRDGERLPQRPDRAAHGLSRLRRPGFGARRLQRPHRVAGPRARRAERHDHRLARAALRRHRARRRACSTGGAPGAASTSTFRRSRPRSTVAHALAARLRGRRRDPRAGRQQSRPARCRTARSACADEGDVGDRWVAIAADDATGRSPTSWTIRLATLDSRATTSRSAASDARRGRAIEVAEQLQAAGIEAVPVADFGDLHDDPQLAARGHFEPHEHPFLGRRRLRTQRVPDRGHAASATSAPDPHWVRTTTGRSPRFSGSTPPKSNGSRRTARSRRPRRPNPYATRPTRCASAAASVRLATPILRKMFDTWTLAVFTEIYSS